MFVANAYRTLHICIALSIECVLLDLSLSEGHPRSVPYCIWQWNSQANAYDIQWGGCTHKVISAVEHRAWVRKIRNEPTRNGSRALLNLLALCGILQFFNATLFIVVWSYPDDAFDALSHLSYESIYTADCAVARTRCFTRPVVKSESLHPVHPSEASTQQMTHPFEPVWVVCWLKHPHSPPIPEKYPWSFSLLRIFSYSDLFARKLG